VISEANDCNHQHANLKRPKAGEFAKSEISILGTNCGNIKQLAYKIIDHLSGRANIAYVDADHKTDNDTIVSDSALSHGASIEYTDKISYQRFDYNKKPDKYQRHVLFNQQDLVLVNGNHFEANAQILIIDPAKSVEKKLEKLSNVVLIILISNADIPGYVSNHLSGKNPLIYSITDEEKIVDFVQTFIQNQVPGLKGLVLSGGRSTRMKKDKGSLNYHGVDQRQYSYNLLSQYCKTFMSTNHEQAAELKSRFDIVEDTFLNLGPVGGILSALQSDPNSAWLTIACDLPYLSDITINYLIEHRNSSKTATAFYDPNGEFPEPLITIWEPRSYLVLLQFVAQGYSCPRKVLINSDIELLHAPDVSEFENVNFPEQYDLAIKQININKNK
jgi:molybdopterin-guanine dinucleotide biosynthesis protein A